MNPLRAPFVLIYELECAVAAGLHLEAKASFEGIPDLIGLGLGLEPGAVQWAEFALVGRAFHECKN
jgi:hypothetical protein